jgi:putative ABC transport system permease protein
MIAVLGIALGFLIPVGLTALVGDALPIKADLTVSARSLLTAVGYGLLVSLLFALWPLGRAEQIRAAVLFRDEVAPERVLPRPGILAFIVGGIILYYLFSDPVQRAFDL